MRARSGILSGLRAQLLLPLLGALVLAEAVSLVMFFSERRQAVRAALGGEIAGRIANVIRLLEATKGKLDPDILRSAESPLVTFAIGDSPETKPDSGRASERIISIIRTGLGDASRSILVSAERAPRHMRLRFAPAGMPDWMREVHRRHHPHAGSPRELSISVALRDGRWLNVSYNFHRPPLQTAWPSIVAMSLAAIAIALVVLWSVQRISRPMKALARSADRLGRGENPEPLELAGPAEIRRVTEAFNMMQERITRHVRERARMLAALGHDLRSPLTAMRLRVEMIEDQEARERLTSTIDEMQSMVESTLSYAKGVAVDEVPAQFNLRAMVEAIADEMRLNGNSVDVEPGEALMQSIRPVSLKRALRNLIENAVKYGGRASVFFRPGKSSTRIVIEDVGPGLPESELARVFEPFVRLDASRSRETGGVGLGLAVARAVARAHGGDIALTNRPDGGLRAEVTLPC